MNHSSRALESIFRIASDRNGTIHTLPTTASQEAIQQGLEALKISLPDLGLGTDSTLEFVVDKILPALAPGHAGPRYMGFVTGGALPAAQLGDFLATIFDQNVQVNLPEDTITTVLESRTLDMLLDLLRLPRERFQARALTTGATSSNVLGLACARDHAVRQALGAPAHSVAEQGFAGATVKVFCDRPHASILKAASIVGIGRANVVDLGRGRDGISLLDLKAKLAECQRDSATAAIVALSFGEVDTGDFSPNISAIRELCDLHGCWLHIDAAFGAFARLLPHLDSVTGGLELADSITADAHKFLNVPYESGIYFSRSVSHQMSTFGCFGSLPPYLSPSQVGCSTSITLEMAEALSIPSPLYLNIENSRRFRALPLFCALMSMGRSGYSELMERIVAFAKDIAEWMSIGEGKKWYEVLNSPPSLNIVLFRASAHCAVVAFRPQSPSGALLLAKAINNTRKMYVSPTNGAVRIAVSNWMAGWKKGEDNLDFEIVTNTLRGVMESPPSFLP